MNEATRQLQILLTLKANVGRAIRNRETVTIGGGEFSDGELITLKLAIECAIEEARLSGNPA